MSPPVVTGRGATGPCDARFAVVLWVMTSAALPSHSLAPPGSYLGEEPPGDVPRVFAPGLLEPEGGFHSTVVFNATMDEAYWTSMEETSYVMRWVDGVWTPPVLLPFDPEYGVGEPMPAGRDRLYFLSRRPPEDDPVERERIWWVEREGSGWSDPRVIDAAVAAHPTHWQFSFTAAQDLYFTSEVGRSQDVYVARYRDGVFGGPERLGEAVNSELREFCPFIAPDETYLLFARSVPQASGRSDLFVSFRDAEGRWTEAVNLGDTVNSRHNEVCPVVTPDGEYLFFTRASDEVNDVYWVRADVIDAARP